MDAGVIDFVSTVGFPIAVCWYLLNSTKQDKEKLYEKLDSYTEVVSNCTHTLERVNDRLDRIEIKLEQIEEKVD